MSRNNAGIEFFFTLNLFIGTKCSSYQIWGPKRFKVTVSLRINARAFITFFKFLEAIYSREVFNLKRAFTRSTLSFYKNKVY